MAIRRPVRTVKVELMGIRTAHSGGTAVRCVRVLLALCVALAVLVHHEISGMIR